MIYKFCVVLLVSLIFNGCSSNTKIVGSSCSKGRTLLDGTCVDEDIVDYVSCVRARGVQLGSNKSKKLSIEVGYIGLKAGGMSEVIENLEKKYSTSNTGMMAIIEQCGSMAKIRYKKRPNNINHPVISNLEAAKIPQNSKRTIEGRWVVRRKGDLSGSFITWIEIKVDVTGLVVYGDRWKGEGSFDGKQGYYLWKFEDGRSGRTDIYLNETEILVGKVKGSGIDWTYWASRVVIHNRESGK